MCPQVRSNNLKYNIDIFDNPDNPRELQMPIYSNVPDQKVKLICAACYLTSGIAGLIYLIVGGKGRDVDYFKFHFYHAILLGIFMLLFGMAGGAIAGIVGGILGLFGGASMGLQATVLTGVGIAIRGFDVVIYLVCLAGIVQSLRGKHIQIPVISKLVRQMMVR